MIPTRQGVCVGHIDDVSSLAWAYTYMLDMYYTVHWYDMHWLVIVSDESGMLELAWNSLGRGGGGTGGEDRMYDMLGEKDSGNEGSV
jgi:hypothetical protein